MIPPAPDATIAATGALDPLREGERGLLLIDVDGPLNPYAAKPTRRPEGYSTYRLTRDGRWFTGSDTRRHKGIRVWLNASHGQLILDLATRTGLRPVWATAWRQEANMHVAPAIGLPELPVIQFPETDLANRMWTATGGWKWPGITTATQNIPLAWWDDEHDDPAWERAKAAFLASRTDTPTLLCHVDPATGLLDTHFDLVERWAATLPT